MKETERGITGKRFCSFRLLFRLPNVPEYYTDVSRPKFVPVMGGVYLDERGVQA